MQRRSRWTGKLVLEQQALHSGVVDPDGNIAVVTGILDDPPNRWRTLIHEALHTFSPRFERVEYRSAPGWEEGIVEQLQRLLRQRVLGTMKVIVPEEAFTAVDSAHLYNRYIRALEMARTDLAEPVEPFYQRLLDTHLTQRFAVLHSLLDTLPEAERGAANVRLLMVHRTLTESVGIR